MLAIEGELRRNDRDQHKLGPELKAILPERTDGEGEHERQQPEKRNHGDIEASFLGPAVDAEFELAAFKAPAKESWFLRWRFRLV